MAVQMRWHQRRPRSLRVPWVTWRSWTTKRMACSARLFVGSRPGVEKAKAWWKEQWNRDVDEKEILAGWEQGQLHRLAGLVAGHEEEIGQVIQAALRAGDVGARQAARDFVNYLVSRGWLQFRDLLPDG